MGLVANKMCVKELGYGMTGGRRQEAGGVGPGFTCGSQRGFLVGKLMLAL